MTEKHTPCEDNDMSNKHSDDAGCNADHDTDQDRDENVHNYPSKESGESTVSVVVTVWSVWAMRTRTTVAVMFVVSLRNKNGADFCLRPRLRAAPLQLRKSICDNGSPFADEGCAFLPVVCRAGS